MGFDDDVRARFDTLRPATRNLGAGARAAARTAGRRQVARRAALATTAVAIAVAGGLAVIRPWAGPGETRIEVTDTSATTQPPTTTAPAPTTPPDDAPGSTDATVDTDPEAPATTHPAPVTTVPPDPDLDQQVWRVVGIPQSQVLTARTAPDQDAEAVFTLPADAPGVVSVGPAMAGADGASWIEVYDAVAADRVATGWVETRFLEALSVTEARPCRFNGAGAEPTADEWSSSTTGEDVTEPAVLAAMESYRFGACIRTVIEFDASLEPVGDERNLVDLPDDIVVERGSPTIIRFGEIVWAARVSASQVRLDLGDGRTHSVFAVIGPEGLTALVYGPSDLVDVRFDAERYAMVVDVADPGPERDDLGGAEPLLDRGNIVFTEAGVSGDRLTITGLARPFEANMGVELRNADGPVLAEFHGAVLPPTPEVSMNAVMTTGWSEGWGRFELVLRLDEDEVDGLLIDFDPSGGNGGAEAIVTVPLAELTAATGP